MRKWGNSLKKKKSRVTMLHFIHCFVLVWKNSSLQFSLGTKVPDAKLNEVLDFRKKNSLIPDTSKPFESHIR